jgi:hypothetical protein
LFDSIVLPILTYSCEVWGFENKFALYEIWYTNVSWSLLNIIEFYCNEITFKNI